MTKGVLVCFVAVSCLALAACGSNKSSSTSTTSTTPAAAAGQTLKVAADPSGALKFNTSTLSAKAGKVTLNFTNQSQLQHNLTLQSSSGQQLGATPSISGSSASFTVTLKPGKYTYFCSVPGHEQGGMKGTLTVK